jgi:ectoine hydrolase
MDVILPGQRASQVPFPESEYSERIENVRKCAAEKELDLLVVTDPKNICYLTGYDAYSFYVPQAYLLPVSGDDPVLVLRQQDVAGALWSTYLKNENIIGYGEEFVSGDEHAMRFVGELIRSRGWSTGVVGINMDGTCLTPSGRDALEHSVPASRLRDAGRLVEWVRTVKSPLEIAAMREAGRLSDHAMNVTLNAIAPGIREAEVAARTYSALIEGVDGITGSCPRRPGMSSGEKTETPHLAWSDAVYKPDQPATIELAGHRHNYAVALSRTVFLGRPNSSYRDLDRLVRDGLDAALTRLRPGYAAEEVEAEYRRVTTKGGHEKNVRVGYSIGLSFPVTDWIDETISIAPGDNTILEPNMTIHLMLAMWLDRVGYAFSETFVVTTDGPESLSRMPRELTVKQGANRAS